MSYRLSLLFLFLFSSLGAFSQNNSNNMLTHFPAYQCVFHKMVTDTQRVRALTEPELTKLQEGIVSLIIARADEKEDFAHCTNPKYLAQLDREVSQVVQYANDLDLRRFHQDDYWQTTGELLTPYGPKSITTIEGFRFMGDCEDHALFKYWLLRRRGCAAEQLQLVELKLSHGEYHMVLAVDLPEGPFILDNRPTATRRYYHESEYYNQSPKISFVNETKQRTYCSKELTEMERKLLEIQKIQKRRGPGK